MEREVNEILSHISALDVGVGIALLMIVKAWLAKIPTRDDVHQIVDKRIDEKLEVMNIKLDQIKEELSKK